MNFWDSIPQIVGKKAEKERHGTDETNADMLITNKQRGQVHLIYLKDRKRKFLKANATVDSQSGRRQLFAE